MALANNDPVAGRKKMMKTEEGSGKSDEAEEFNT
jgi:hypothetical protein